MSRLALLIATTVAACGGGGGGSGSGINGGGTPTSSSTLVGPAGGTASLASGPTLTFSPGALAADTTIIIRNTGAVSPGGGPTFEFLPAGLTFPADSVIVAMPIPPGTSRPTISWSQPGSGTAFDALSTAVVGGTATAHVAHFSNGYVSSCVAVCSDSWSGTSASTIGYTPIDAAITWTLDTAASTPGKSDYYPVGTVTVHSYTDVNGCLVTYSPSSTTVDGHNNGGDLVVDETGLTPTYAGQGLTQWLATITMTCPDGSGGTGGPLPTGGMWLFGTGGVTDSGLTISGTSSAIGQTFTYDFQR